MFHHRSYLPIVSHPDLACCVYLHRVYECTIGLRAWRCMYMVYVLNPLNRAKMVVPSLAIPFVPVPVQLGGRCSSVAGA
jgi:hypothetical protein